MALTELQLPAKIQFYDTIRRAATDINRYSKRWEDLSELIDLITTDDLDTMGVPTGQIRTDLINFKTTLSEIVDFINGTATTQTNIPAEIVDKLRAIQ